MSSIPNQLIEQATELVTSWGVSSSRRVVPVETTMTKERYPCSSKRFRLERKTAPPALDGYCACVQQFIEPVTGEQFVQVLL